MVIQRYFLQNMALVFFLSLGCVQASEMLVTSRVVTPPVVVGDPALVSVTLSNDTGSTIHNVDLRLAGAEMMVGGIGVVQLGTLGMNEIGTVLVKLIPSAVDGSLPARISWRVDYDVSAGNHVQIELGSELSTEE